MTILPTKQPISGWTDYHKARLITNIKNQTAKRGFVEFSRIGRNMGLPAHKVRYMADLLKIPYKEFRQVASIAHRTRWTDAECIKLAKEVKRQMDEHGYIKLNSISPLFGRSSPAIEDQCKSMELEFIRHDSRARKVKVKKVKLPRYEKMNKEKVIAHLRKVMLNYEANRNEFNGKMHG
jgi:hypothetical protein